MGLSAWVLNSTDGDEDARNNAMANLILLLYPVEYRY